MANDYSYYPLTYPQRNIYKTEITYPGTPIGIITATMRIVDDDIDFDKMEKALNMIIEHNDSLRIRIKLIDREPRQYFSEYEYEKYEVIDLRGQPIQKLYEFDSGQTALPMPLYDSQLYKFTLIWIKDNEFAVFLKIHHLISDGWSTVRIGNYILDYYEKLQKGVPIDFDNTPSYKEYISSESEYLTGAAFGKDREFWSTKFDESHEPSIIKPRKSNLVGIEAQRKTFVLPDRLVAQLRQYCKDTRTSIFGVILSAFAVYLNRTTHRNDITIGTLVLNRSSRRQKNTVGMFISTVPIKVEFESDTNFTDFNKLLTREWMAVLKHQRYPFEMLLKDVREKTSSPKDLFDIVFSYQNASFTENTSSKERTSRWHFNHAQKESLTIHVHDRDDVGKLLLDYDFLKNLFYEKEIEFIHDNFIRILWHALDNPVKPMSDLELISEAEKRRILFDFNSKTVDYPQSQTLIDLFEEQAIQVPDNIAVIHEDRQVTYAELDKMVNSLANRLVAEGIKSEDIVSLMIDKSIEMVAAIFAILKAGGAYLAVDGDFPQERKKYLFSDSGSKILITTDEYAETSGFEGKIISLSGHDFTVDTKRPAKEINSSDLAYVIYTSGTTGEPKGVMVEHKSVVNYVYSFLDEFKYTGNERVLQQSFYSFDAFVEEVYPTLSSGACLVVAGKNGSRDIEKLADTINKNNVTLISVSPLVLNELNKMDCFDSVKTYISGGDVLKYEYIDNLIEKADVYNTYGPTETTVCATYHKCEKKVVANIPIGSPISNYKMYILDKNLSLLPIGVTGEIYISGPGLARGYLNHPELTEKAFIENPYLPGEKMYKTNDIGRWFPMGEIEFMGRSDSQIKIRGMRIELAEIESQMLRHESIKAAVVIAKDVEGRKMLCSYYEATDSVGVQDLRSFLRSKLPRHMIPSYYLQMERLPLTTSGKVNTKALPGIAGMVLNEENEFVAPKDEIEEKTIDILKGILKAKKISMKDNFFDLGGDSLSLNTLVFDLIDAFEVDIPLDFVFRANDIQEIADYIKKNTDSVEEKKHEKNLMLIRKGDPGGKDIFFIHDGIGGIGAYFDIAQNLKEYNIWGIRVDNHLTVCPQNVKIEEVAASYVQQIVKESDPPYNIAGWCIGGTIAFEIVKQLEELGHKVDSLFIIDSIPPLIWEDAAEFSAQGEKRFIKENIKYADTIKDFVQEDSMLEIWEKTVENIERSPFKMEIVRSFVSIIPDDIKQYLKEYGNSETKDIFIFINRVRTFHIARALYFPEGKIRSDITYLGANANSVCVDNSIWPGLY